MSIEKEFGVKIAIARKEAGMSQTELAKGICSVQHIKYIENGKRNLSFNLGCLLSERLEVDLFNLYFEVSKGARFCKFGVCYNPCDDGNCCAKKINIS